MEKRIPNKFLYFANQHQLLHYFGLTIVFTSFNDKILKTIEELFGDFLLITNFGTRSSKGYGSFSLDSFQINDVFKKYFKKVFKLKARVNNLNWEETVDRFHKRMKAGINYNGYEKSLLFEYMCNNGIRWEKRRIKQAFPSLSSGKPPIDCDGEFRYVRSMLGLAEINEYNKGNDTVRIQHRPKGHTPEERKNKKIDRFQTPILYKVINQAVYLLPDDSYKKIMGESFNFSYNSKDFNIDTPSGKEFDLLKFLEFIEKKRLIEEVKEAC
ncbi:MAG: hypothetical protein HQK75_13780 [Candidatus Magnetomorum sp.]|nr:hypothetical protein [Candidatus Magnetomorum sp.]